MSFVYLEDLATADIAFEATGRSLGELFVAAADATMNVMIEDLATIKPVRDVDIELRAEQPDMLLFDFLQELIFYKDAEQLLLRVRSIDVEKGLHHFSVKAKAVGETLDPDRHGQRVDVKAVTLHRFTVEQVRNDLWRAVVILDV